ncbi:MAG TPA: hypothetical protein VF498_16035 [Anaerolineales bacterium]
MERSITFGLPRMHVEAGERRDFLPEFVAGLEKNGAQVVMERGYGSGMGFSEADYLALAPYAMFASKEEAYRQDYVLLVRCPANNDLELMRPGACLISMLHYPTRPQRVEFLRSLGIEAISLDSIKDDSGRRVIENLRAVAWNGIEAAYETLRPIYPPPGFESPERNPIRVTLLGSGAVGVHVVQAAIRYGNPAIWHAMIDRKVPGVQVTVVDYDTTRFEKIMAGILTQTDMLVDATQRPDASKAIIPNDWVAYLPSYAVLLDLSVDPYYCEPTNISAKGIEGIPQGNLDQYVFAPDDPAFDAIPACFNTRYRRYTVSCYSWPGVHPKECMAIYGDQLRPIVRKLMEKGGVLGIQPGGSFFERAISRAMLSRWTG